MRDDDPALVAARRAVSTDLDDPKVNKAFDDLVARYGWTAASEAWQLACDEFDRRNA